MALTDAQCRAARPGERRLTLRDGLGLELLITPAGLRAPSRKIWRVRYTLDGQQYRVAIGEFPETGLSAARDEAAKIRLMVRREENPAPSYGSVAGVVPAKEPLTEFEAVELLTKDGEVRAGWRQGDDLDMAMVQPDTRCDDEADPYETSEVPVNFNTLIDKYISENRTFLPKPAEHILKAFALWSANRSGVSETAAEAESLEDVISGYLSEVGSGWATRTAKTYGSSIKLFSEWATANGILEPNKLTPRALESLRAHLISMPKHGRAKGKGKRGKSEPTNEPRSGDTINGNMRTLKTMLQNRRRAGCFPFLSMDDIADSLRLVDVNHPRPDPLKPPRLQALLEACGEYDSQEREPIGFLVVVMLLTGMRLGEALRLDWADVDLYEKVIRVVGRTKTKEERDIDLEVTPFLIKLLESKDGTGKVFGFDEESARDARYRLIHTYKAPAFLWSTRNSVGEARSAPTLRSTCGCYLTCAPSLYKAASAYHSARRLGHSVAVAEKHYLNVMRRIPDTATTLEAAMEIEDELERLFFGAKRKKVRLLRG